MEIYPPNPNFKPLISTPERQRVFGTFQYVAKPVKGNPENIVVTDNWAKLNIVRAYIPQLEGVPYAPHDGCILLHRLVVPQTVSLFAAWEQAGLLKYILSWGGSYVPRFIRGSRSILSNHAFGSAFDLNAPWNALGRQPAPRGAQGSVMELVALANENGFYWGGHFSNRLDGMHFEAAHIL